MKTLKKGLVLGLTACMAAASLAGCAKEVKEFDPTATAATFEGTEVSAGVANFLMRYQQAQFETYYGAMMKSLYGANIWTTSLDGSGVTYGTTFKNDIQVTLEKMLLAEKHAADYGIELTEEETAAISEAAQAFIEANSEELLNEMSATEENITRVMSLYTLQFKVEQEMGADVDTEVADEDAAQMTVQYARFDPTSEPESETGDETEAKELLSAKERAEAFLETAKTAEDFVAAAAELDEADEDAGASYFTFGKDDTFPDAAIINAVWDIKEDGTLLEEVIEVNEDYYYVLYVEDAFDDAAVEAKKAEIVSERKQEAVAALYEEWMKDVKYEVEEKVWDQMIYDISLTIVMETEASTEATTEAAGTEVETEEVTETAGTEVVTEAVETETEK